MEGTYREMANRSKVRIFNTDSSLRMYTYSCIFVPRTPYIKHNESWERQSWDQKTLIEFKDNSDKSCIKLINMEHEQVWRAGRGNFSSSCVPENEMGWGGQYTFVSLRPLWISWGADVNGTASRFTPDVLSVLHYLINRLKPSGNYNYHPMSR